MIFRVLLEILLVLWITANPLQGRVWLGQSTENRTTKGCGCSKEAKAKSPGNTAALCGAHVTRRARLAACSLSKGFGFSAGFVGIGIEECVWDSDKFPPRGRQEDAPCVGHLLFCFFFPLYVFIID